MREFGIDFTKGLKRGLRAFPNAVNTERELIECYNLAPSELQLIPHDPIVGIDLAELEDLTPPELDGLRAYWALEESGTLLDSLGNIPLARVADVNEDNLTQLAGRVNNGQLAQQLNAQQGTDSEGAVGSDHSALTLLNQDWSINLWLQYSAVPGFSYWILRKADTGSNIREWGVELQGTSVGTFGIVFYRGNGTTTWSNSLTCPITSRINVWHMIHISYVYSTTTLRIRVSNTTDGFEAFSANSTAFPALVNTSGAVRLAQFFDTAEGTVNFIYDEIGVWGVEVSSTVRSRLWNGGAGRTYPFL